jgi:hypothetical protein
MLPIPLMTTTADGAVLDANGAAAELLGMGAGELRRTPVFDLMAGEAERSGRSLLGLASRGDAVEGTLTIRSRGGADVICQVTLVPGSRPAQPCGGRAECVRWLLRPMPADVVGEAPIHETYLAAVTALCGIGVTDGELRGLLRRVAELAGDGVPGADAASVVVGNPAEPELVATSSTLAQGGDGAQHLAASGPTFAAYRTGRVVGTRDLFGDPGFVALARSASAEARSCLALPVPLEDGGTGAVLTLYARRRGSLAAGTTTEAARPFVTAVGALIRDARLVAGMVAEREQLHEALRYRSVIERAKGMIMMSRDCDADAAFSVLVRMSNAANRKLRDIAEEFVTTGRPPAGREAPARPVTPS